MTQFFIKLAGQIMFWINQLMALIWFYFQVVIRVHLTFGRPRGRCIIECFGWLLVAI